MTEVISSLNRLFYIIHRVTAAIQEHIFHVKVIYNSVIILNSPRHISVNDASYEIIVSALIEGHIFE